MSVLEIKNLHVSVEDKEILKGLNLTLKLVKLLLSWGLTELVNLPFQLLSWVTQTMKSQKGTSFLMVKASLTWKLTNVHA